MAVRAVINPVFLSHVQSFGWLCRRCFAWLIPLLGFAVAACQPVVKPTTTQPAVFQPDDITAATLSRSNNGSDDRVAAVAAVSTATDEEAEVISGLISKLEEGAAESGGIGSLSAAEAAASPPQPAPVAPVAPVVPVVPVVPVTAPESAAETTIDKTIAAETEPVETAMLARSATASAASSPPPPPPPPLAQLDHQRLVGLSADKIIMFLGAPERRRAEHQLAFWLYQQRSCILYLAITGSDSGQVSASILLPRKRGTMLDLRACQRQLAGRFVGVVPASLAATD